MYATDYRQVGLNIQAELVRKGISQQNLADALSISKQVMSKIIKGAKAINVYELSKIASVLETTTDSLLTAKIESCPVESMSFMGSIRDEETLSKINIIQKAIDEIHLLEDILYDE